jgi:predicted Zn-dependent peptidase
MSERIDMLTLPNGMTLLGKEMEHVASASLAVALPVGAAHDPEGMSGAAAVADEWWSRGAGDMDTRALNDAFDALGCHHFGSAGMTTMRFGGSFLARDLNDVLELYADVVRRPRLLDEDFEPCRQLVLQTLADIEDVPASRARIYGRKQFFPTPLGNSSYGTAEGLEALTADVVRDHAMNKVTPNGAVVAIAGRFDWGDFCKQMEDCFGDWQAPPVEPIKHGQAPGGFYHDASDSAQTHMALLCPAINGRHEDYTKMILATGVLSAGTASRLFTEVREKRGLVYHVSCSNDEVDQVGAMFAYTACVPEKAQETLEVTVGEIRRLGEGITDEEFARTKTQLKCSLLMDGDSTVTQAMRMSSLWRTRGDVWTLEEACRRIDETTVDEVLAFVNAHPAQHFAGAFIGPDMPDTSCLEG